MDYYKMFFLLIGGLGIFFYGMHTLSESLQGIAGDLMRKIINVLTTNRLMAVSVGVFVTMLVQSSSITTVMIVGFVNAGLMKLTQALGVIFGANIGTTITGWIITIKIGKYGLPMLGFGALLYIFSKPYRLKLAGKLVFALGAIFFGLQNMSSAFKPLRTNEEFINYLSVFAGDTFISVLACVAMGAILTMIVQSSSAMLAITMALALTNVISFQTGAALVLGENIGTTITAMLASIGTTYTARRAAYGHMFFNVLGVFVMVVIFAPYIQFVEWLIPGDANLINAAGEKPNVAAHIATVHTVFNVSATLLFLPFLPHLARFVSFLVPEPKEGEGQPHQLTNLMNVSAKAPALAMEQVFGETRKMAELVQRSLDDTIDVVLSTDENRKKKDHIHHLEDIADKIQLEITIFLGDLMEARLPPETSTQVFGLVDIVDNLESISDYCSSIAKYKDRLFHENQFFNEETRKELSEFLEEIRDFYREAIQVLVDESEEHLKKCQEKTRDLGHAADAIKDKHLVRIRDGEYPPIMGLAFSDMVVSMRRIKNHTFNVAEAFHVARSDR